MQPPGTALMGLGLAGLLMLIVGAAPAAAQPALGDYAAGDILVSTPRQTAAARARAAGRLTARPSHAELKAIWEGGTWSQDIGRAGGFLSGFKSDEEYYENPDFVPPNPVPLEPGPKAVAEHIRREMNRGRQIFGPYGECHPSGMPYILTMSGYGGYEVVVADNELDMYWGNQRERRRIFLDGRKRPDERTSAPLYNGFSVAHWEGKTMVVETTNIRGGKTTQIEPYLPKAPGAYIIERYTPIGPGRIDLEMTMWSSDFTRPWVVRLKLTNDPKGRLIEGLCGDDNHWAYAKDGELTLSGPDGKPLEKAEP